MATLNIYSTEWLNVVFSERNKAYGAYDLRSNNSKITSKALWTGSSFFILLILLPFIMKHLPGADYTDRTTERIVTLIPPKLVKPLIPPPAIEPPKNRTDQVKFPPMEVVSHPVTEEPPTIDRLKIADPGQKDLDGDPGAGIEINVSASAVQANNIIEGPPNDIFTGETVQVLPRYPGGSEAWSKFMKGYRYPPAAIENSASGIVYVSFIVETDGSLTDIKVLRAPGYGTGEEAIRLLKTSIKWQPGVQNGRKVRVAYTQPIVLNIN